MQPKPDRIVSGILPETGTFVSVQIAGREILSVEGANASRDRPGNPSATPVEELATEGRTGGHLRFVSGGFFDIQVNGYGGREFSSPALNVEDVDQIAYALWRFGTNRFLPTLTTQSQEVLSHACQVLSKARAQDRILCARIPGLHLEGPYISPQDGPRGAHPLAHVRAPDWDEFCRLQDSADGAIRLITMSPEYEQAPDFIRRAVQTGVVVAIGHTAANQDQIARAADAGATLSTHLGNGAHPMLPRHPNYLWEQLAEDRLWASLIVDGWHLPASFVRVAVRAKSPQRCILVSDLSGMAGLPPGRYQTELCPLEVLEDGRLVIAGQATLLAGASRPIGSGIINMMDYAGVSLLQALAMAVENPARLLKTQPARVRPGDMADLIVFEVQSRPAPPSGKQDKPSGKQDKRDAIRREIDVREVFFQDFHAQWDT